MFLQKLRIAWRDKWLFIAAFGLLWQARLAVWFLGVRDPHKRLVRPSPGPAAPLPVTRRIAACVDGAAGYVPSATCLVRAIAGQRLLSAKGYGSEVRVGVRKGAAAGFEAHAWLVSGGGVVLGGTSGELAGYRLLIGAE